MSEEKIYPSMVIRSQAKAIELLEKENQQLKEELQKADSITQSCIFDGKKESEINFRKAINLIEQYKSVLDEIREFLNNNRNCCYMDSDIDKLLQILDKVKE